MRSQREETEEKANMIFKVLNFLSLANGEVQGFKCDCGRRRGGGEESKPEDPGFNRRSRCFRPRR